MPIENSGYRVCTKCVMDTIANTEISFDDDGVCSYCHHYDYVLSRQLHDEPGDIALNDLLDRVRSTRQGKYDCILGVSGGSDSSYTAYLLHRAGLRVLMVHCDNGWDDGAGVHNIRQLAERLGYDIYNYVIDWPEFRDVQLSILKASVMDIEIVSDHVNIATLFHAAVKHHVRWIFTGENLKTEGTMPGCWIHNKNDLYHIRSIHRRFGALPMRTFPQLGFMRKKYYEQILGISIVPLLNFVPYHKKRAIEILQRELDWQHPGGKHFESLFTRLYQTHILPVKFGVDKRKAHLSTLIQSGQITRAEAEAALAEEIISPEALAVDKDKVLKKLALSESEFQALMAIPPKAHSDYPCYFLGFGLLNRIRRAR
ncbi:MAG: N-acetyl sugar amidotransferase [Bacteroidetes bacterium]|nr:N-acetyl sugar amidotransferase [Bacteroidota bacterium]